MSKALITEGYLTDIANAIRAKNGSADTYTPPQMAAAIAAIPTGSNVDVEPLNVTQNGTYTAPSGKAYSPVTVNVSGGGGGNIIYGTDAPAASQGSDGDVYFKYSAAGVKNTAGQYIDIEYSGGPNSVYVLEFSLASAQTTNWPTVFGVRDSAGSVSNAIGIHMSISERNYSGAMVSWSNAQTGISGIGATAFIGKYGRIKLQSGSIEVTVGGVTTSYPINVGTLTATQAHMCLFGMIAGGSLQAWSYINNMVLYSFKIYEGESLVHSFVPAKDSSDVVCIYDEITQQYKYHSGGGTLQYIESNEITNAYLKQNGAWVNAIGATIN